MGYEVIGTYKPDNLIASHEVPLLTEGVLLAAGQGILKRGSVIGIITASQKGKLCLNTATDGSQSAKYILTADVDTTTDAMAVCYKSGIFTKSALIFGGTDTVANHAAELRILNIHVRGEY